MAKNVGYTTILGASTEYNGQLTFKGTVRIDGRFKGDILSDGKLVLGKEAVVEGSLRVSELEVQGTLNGDIFVSKLTVLHRTARMNANLVTALLIMEEGALFHGNLIMGDEAAKADQFSAEHSLNLPKGTKPSHEIEKVIKQ